MNGADPAAILYALVLLVLVGSAVAARRMPIGRMLGYLVVWAAIFGAGFLLFAVRDDLRPILDRVKAEVDPTTPRVTGKLVCIAMSPDGHFWVDGSVGGTSVRFLIDSGATTTALSPDAVSATGLSIDTTRPEILRTANGDVRADHVRLPTLVVGSIRLRDFDAVTAGGFGEVSVLGMNFLSALKRWSVEGHTLILEP